MSEQQQGGSPAAHRACGRATVGEVARRAGAARRRSDGRVGTLFVKGVWGAGMCEGGSVVCVKGGKRG